MSSNAPCASEAPLVLLIDDDEVSREVTATLLRLSGMAVEAAASGQEAVAALESGLRPSLILMDAQMPGLHGLELIEELRRRAQTRIALISGSQPADPLTAAADAVLLKPFTPEAVRELLEQTQTPEEANASQSAPVGAPVVRREILAQFRAAMPEESLLQIYRAIVADLRRRLEPLAAAIQAGDLEEMARIGHAIKGGCAMAGAAQAAQLGACLESSPADYYSDNGQRILTELRAAAETLERMLERNFPA